jgi:hypothetical protein
MELTEMVDTSGLPGSSTRRWSSSAAQGARPVGRRATRELAEGYDDLNNETQPNKRTAQLYLSDSSAGTAPKSDPSLNECRDAINTAALPFRIQVKPNEGICIRSDEGHIAAIRVLSIDEATGTVGIDVVLWELEFRTSPVV